MEVKILSFKIYAVLSNFYIKNTHFWRMETYVSAVPAYKEVFRLMKVEFTEKVTGNRKSVFHINITNNTYVLYNHW